MKKNLFDQVSMMCSSLTTKSYSTSFSMGILLFDKSIRNDIYAIYGFVRFADEIVDTFHGYDQQYLLEKFKNDTYEAIENRISLNPILNAFQIAVNKYEIDIKLIDQFLHSMEMDLEQQEYDEEKYNYYILGSAEVVGLMCLHVFCHGDKVMFEKLKTPAMKLGSAFQKINFLRDLNEDYKQLGRTYFPQVDMESFDMKSKQQIESDIQKDFEEGYQGIMQLPRSSKMGVYLAYVYYYALFKKIKKVHAQKILEERIRIPNQRKYSMLLGSYIKYNLILR
jgi:phytoene/squalene synthetase